MDTQKNTDVNHMHLKSNEATKLTGTVAPEYARGFSKGYEAGILENATKNREALLHHETLVSKNTKMEVLLQTLFRISELSHNSQLTIEALYKSVCLELSHVIDTSNFYIARLENEGQVLNFCFYQDTYGLEKEYAHDFPRRPVANGLTEMVIKAGETMLLSHIQIINLSKSGKLDPRTHSAESWLGAPLNAGGKMLGVVVVQSYTDDLVFTESDARLFHFASQHISSAIYRYEEKTQEKSERERLELVAKYDGLTGLLNRESMNRRIDSLLSKDNEIEVVRYALLFIDLDGFKQVNDDFGHLIGDKLLIRVSEILTSIVREGDAVCRLGGDEFLILLDGLSNKDSTVNIVNRILCDLEFPLLIDELSVSVGASIGVIFDSPAYTSQEALLKAADDAMYKAKNNGKHQYCIG